MRITEIEVAGQKYPASFGMAALDEFCQEKEMTLGSFIGKLDGARGVAAGATQGFDFYISDFSDLLFFAMKHGHRKAKRDFSLTREDALDFFDEEPGLLVQVIQAFAESFQTAFEPKKKEKPQAEKKRASKTA